MKGTLRKRLVSLLLCVAMVLSILPAAAYGDIPSAEGDTSLESVERDYTTPAGITMERMEEYCQLGDDMLFVIHQDGRYYAMQSMPVSDTAYKEIPAVDITDWMNPDGTLTVPADTKNVSFWRRQEINYSYMDGIPGENAFMAASYTFLSSDGDSNNNNDGVRTYYGSFKLQDLEEYAYWIDQYDYYSFDGSGTLAYQGYWRQSWLNGSATHDYALIVDVKDGDNGGKVFYVRYLGTDVPYTGGEVEGYIYRASCRHQFTVRHAPGVEPTCLCKGVAEYWYCEGCDQYYGDKAMTQCLGDTMPIQAALGHDWDADGCQNCGRPVPVYSMVTNQAEFDALAEDTMYVLVAEYNGKYYTPDICQYLLYGVDSDGDGYRDIFNVDANGNGTPDALEKDEDETGVYDYLEWDMNGDGALTEEDRLDYCSMLCQDYLNQFLYGSANIPVKEITPNADGTISHAQVQDVLGFEMVDRYTDEEIEEMLQWGPIYEDWWSDDYLYTYQSLKQFVSPGSFISAPSLIPVERQVGQRVSNYDARPWVILFYNDRYPVYDTWEEMAVPLTYHPVCKENSVVAFATYDNNWAANNDQMKLLRLRDYEGTLTFVSGEDWELEGSEYIYETDSYDTHDVQAPIYLYASQPYTAQEKPDQPEETGTVVLKEDTRVELELHEDLYVDLSSFDMSGTIVANGRKVYLKDSTTDDYTCEDIGYFNCVDENGAPIVPERICIDGDKKYLTIHTEEGYSFHRFDLGITHMTLAPETTGLGYKSSLLADRMVMAQLDEAVAFTFRLQLEGYKPVYRYFDRADVASGEPISLRIRNYDVDGYSEHKLYAQVSITLSDGTVIEAAQVDLTFRWLAEQVNANYADYSQEQLVAFRTLLEQFAIVDSWKLDNLFPAA